MAAKERRFRYAGPHDEVYVPALGKGVKRNHQLAVDDAAVADSLAQQADWKEIGAEQKDEPAPTQDPKG